MADEVNPLKGHAVITVSMVLMGLAIVIAASDSPITGAINWVRSKVDPNGWQRNDNGVVGGGSGGTWGPPTMTLPPPGQQAAPKGQQA